MTDAPIEDMAPAVATAEDANEPMVAVPGIASGEWPEAPVEPAVPTHPDQPGNRLRIYTHVSIFGLPALEEHEVFDIPEVHYAADQGLLDILE